MKHLPVLYVGIAAPLLEEARVWRIRLAREIESLQIPIDTYALEAGDGLELQFRTSCRVRPERLREVIEEQGHTLLTLYPGTHTRSLPVYDYPRMLAGLQQGLADVPIRIVPRIGLTRTLLQQDLKRLRPDLIALHCEGTAEGCLVLEDGQGRAHFLPGEDLVPLLRPRPSVLFLDVTHAQAIMRRNESDPKRPSDSVIHRLVRLFRYSRQDSVWQDTVIIQLDADQFLGVAATVAAQGIFFKGLIEGKTAGEAFEDSVCYIAERRLSDSAPTVTVLPGVEVRAPGFYWYNGPQDLRLAIVPDQHATPLIELSRSPRIRQISRTARPFVGRHAVMVRGIDALSPPLPDGESAAAPGWRRLVTLIGPAGAGKSTLALALADWHEHRNLFAGGIFEWSSGGMASVAEWLMQLLQLFGVPPQERQGDLLQRLTNHIKRRFPAGVNVLLVLDGLENLLHPATRANTLAVMEGLLATPVRLWVLATADARLGLTAHERTIEVPPLTDDEAYEFMLSCVSLSKNRAAVLQSRQNTAHFVWRLMGLAGGQPLALRLLARQLNRENMSPESLYEALQGLSSATAPTALVGDGVRRRRHTIKIYEFCYRQLSEQGKQLFKRLFRFPGGIICGTFAEHWLNWPELLGDDWKSLLNKELERLDLVHFEPRNSQGTGEYFLLPPALMAFARRRYRPDPDWEIRWIDFWETHLRYWNEQIRRQVAERTRPAGDPPGAAAELDWPVVIGLLSRTQANWRAAFAALIQRREGPRLYEWIQIVMPFLQESERLLLLQELLEDAIGVLQENGLEDLLARCLLQQGGLLEQFAQLPAARQRYEEAITCYRQGVESRPDTFTPKLAAALNRLGHVLCLLSDLPAARRRFEEALLHYRYLVRVDPAIFTPLLAETLCRFGDLLGPTDLPAACRVYAEALGYYRQAAGPGPAIHELDVATTLGKLAKAQYTMGDKSSARASFEEALIHLDHLARTQPAVFEPRLATTLDNLGAISQDLGDLDAAQRAFKGALAAYQRAARFHPDTFTAERARTLNRLGAVLHRLDNLRGAHRTFQEALTLYRSLAQVDPSAFDRRLAGTFNNIGTVLLDLGEHEAARQAYNEALLLYLPHYQAHPERMRSRFIRTLRNYNRTGGDLMDDDPWRKFWRLLGDQPSPPETENPDAE